MKCMKCGAELQENEKICRVCGQETETVETNALKEETKGTSDTTDGLAASEQAVSESPEPEKKKPEKKKSGKMMIGVAAAVAAVGIGIAVVPRLMEDPKKYPENTSLQRNARKYLMQGGRLGSGLGVIAAD